MAHRRVYLGDLGANVTETEIRGLVESVAKVQMITFHPADQPPFHGFAIVEMETAEDAKAVMNSLRGLVLDGIPLIAYTIPPKSVRRQKPASD